MECQPTTTHQSSGYRCRASDKRVSCCIASQMHRLVYIAVAAIMIFIKCLYICVCNYLLWIYIYCVVVVLFYFLFHNFTVPAHFPHAFEVPQLLTKTKKKRKQKQHKYKQVKAATHSALADCYKNAR